jgi:peptidoglycan LD-endopeptidase LytH
MTIPRRLHLRTRAPLGFLVWLACFGGPALFAIRGQPFLLPTANRALFEPGKEAEFFVGTVGKSWTSGTYGCVRSDGWQFHEGLDIRCLQRDKRGEPIDPVMATADGTVAYANRKAGLSNYGNYIILRHRIEGMEIYSLYAHLSQLRESLQSGVEVKAGETVGIMGRTANTREGISKERAHVHFELNLLLTDRFGAWYRKHYPANRNDHGNWNGQALVGLDAMAVLLSQKELGTNFHLLTFIRNQTELCRAYIKADSLPWLERYPALIRPNPLALKEGVGGYEVALNFAGLPFQITPRAASEFSPRQPIVLMSVNHAEYKLNPCRRIITLKQNRFELTTRGIELLDLLRQ